MRTTAILRIYALVLNAVPCAFLYAEPVGTAKQIVEHFHMQRIPDEGPWFSASYVSNDLVLGAVLPARYHGKTHAAGSAIYCLITREDFSAMHRLATDETWHFYGGSPLEMLLLYPDGHGDKVILGSDVLAGQQPQFTVPHGVWQGSIPMGAEAGAYSLIGDQLAPAFDYNDFEIGYRDTLQKAYPSFTTEVAGLTRSEFIKDPNTTNSAASIKPVDSGAVFSTESMTATEVSSGLLLRGLVGRDAVVRSELYSIALFTLEKGHSTATSHNQISQETLLITHGSGQINLADRTIQVKAGAVVSIPPESKHSMKADGQENLEFYAVEGPAFETKDYVVDK